MSRVYQGRPIAEDCRIGIVCGRFNELITKQLLAGCEDELRRHGVQDDGIEVFWVPGAFEVPLVAGRLAKKGRYQAIICLGAVIRGATSHFDYVAGEAAKGIAGVAKDADLPVVFGVLTTDTIEQAIERAGTKAGNKGRDSAITAIEMIDLLKQIDALGS